MEPMVGLWVDRRGHRHLSVAPLPKCTERAILKTLTVSFFCLLGIAIASGCANRDLSDSAVAEEQEYPDARGGFINSMTFSDDGDGLRILSRASWQGGRPERLNNGNTYVLDSGRMGKHDFRIVTSSSAREVIRWYSENQILVRESLELSRLVIPNLIEWFGFPSHVEFDIDIVLGTRQSPLLHEVASQFGDGPVRITVTDSPFYTYPHDLAPGTFSKAVHEIAHLKYALQSERLDSPDDSYRGVRRRINEESAATILETCTKYRFYREFSKAGLEVPNFALSLEYEWLPQLFPGVLEGQFAPNADKLGNLSPLNQSWERIAYAVLILLAEDRILDVHEDSAESAFVEYCRVVKTGVPDYLSGHVWP